MRPSLHALVAALSFGCSTPWAYPAVDGGIDAMTADASAPRADGAPGDAPTLDDGARDANFVCAPPPLCCGASCACLCDGETASCMLTAPVTCAALRLYCESMGGSLSTTSAEGAVWATRDGCTTSVGESLSGCDEVSDVSFACVGT